MSVYRPAFTDLTTGKQRKAKTYWFDFVVAGTRYRESTGTAKWELAKEVEKRRRAEIEAGLAGVTADRQAKRARVTKLAEAADALLAEYTVRHPNSATFAEHALRHVKQHLGALMLIEVGEKTVREYQTARLTEEAAPKSINDETGFLLRLLGDRGDAIRLKLRRDRALKLKMPAPPGKAFTAGDQERMLAAALESTLAARRAMARARRGEKATADERQGGSPNIYPALVLALNAGMRDAEIKALRWSQLDFDKRVLTVGKAKTKAGEGRTIPSNGAILSALADHARWYAERFGETRPAWYVFPGGGRSPKDPAVAVTTLKTAWRKVREAAGVTGRWHDARHTLITELAESGAGDQTIMQIAGHVSRQMLSRYSHIRMTAMREALEAVEKRRAERAQTPKTGPTLTAGAPAPKVVN